MKTTIKMLSFFMGLSGSLCFAQNARGLVRDDDAYNNTLMKAPLTRGLYVNLPKVASLKKYCPTPGNQNPHSTCVGWASCYAARTILWAKQNNITNTTEITHNAFSPGFVYRQIVVPSDFPACDQGARISDAMQTLKERGAVFYRDYNTLCPDQVPNQLFSTAQIFKINNYARLFGISDPAENKINATKKSLAESNPVVIGMSTPVSFQKMNSELWEPYSQERNNPLDYDGHAICVIGYDDQKFGGAFEILNSWGTNWGNSGFFWVRYADYAAFTKYAFELIGNIAPAPPMVVVTPPQPTPQPTPQPKPNDYDFAGDIRIVLDNGTTMTANVEEVRGLFVPDNSNPTPSPSQPKPAPYPNNPNTTLGKFIAYRVNRSYTEGTRFRIFLRNNEPAYVYAIAMDGTNRAVQIFPHKPSISPALNYKNNEVALPSEQDFVQMDNVRGLDILCLLYSKKELNIADICSRLEQESGTFFQRLHKVMAADLVPREYLRYYNERMRFEIKSNGQGTVVPIVVEIPHE